LVEQQNISRGVEEGWSPIKVAIRACMLALIAFVAAYASIELTRLNGHVAAIWMPDAIILASVLRGPGRAAYVLLVGGYLGNAAPI
jgi:integral membrane sensor domain MASE1